MDTTNTVRNGLHRHHRRGSQPNVDCVIGNCYAHWHQSSTADLKLRHWAPAGSAPAQCSPFVVEFRVFRSCNRPRVRSLRRSFVAPFRKIRSATTREIPVLMQSARQFLNLTPRDASAGMGLNLPLDFNQCYHSQVSPSFLKWLCSSFRLPFCDTTRISRPILKRLKKLQGVVIFCVYVFMMMDSL